MCVVAPAPESVVGANSTGVVCTCVNLFPVAVRFHLGGGAPIQRVILTELPVDIAPPAPQGIVLADSATVTGSTGNIDLVVGVVHHHGRCFVVRVLGDLR